MQMQNIPTMPPTPQAMPAPERVDVHPRSLVVFPEFDESVHVLDALPSFNVEPCKRYVSLRSGFTRPFVATWYCHYTATDILIAVQEWRAYRQTTEFIVDKVRELTEALWQQPRLTPVRFIGGTTEAWFSRYLNDFHIYRPDIQACVGRIQQRLTDKKLFFYRDASIETSVGESVDGVPSVAHQRLALDTHNGLTTLFQVLTAIR